MSLADAWKEVEGHTWTDETTRAHYDACLEEGHLIELDCLDDETPDEELWAARCSCGAQSALDPPDPDPDGPIVLRTFDEVRWWCRDHRTANGLAWQAWLPHTGFLQRLEVARSGDPHLIAGLQLNEDGVAHLGCRWVGICRCGLDALTAAGDRPVFQADSDVELLMQAAAHRAEHGLPPQPVLLRFDDLDDA